MKAVGIDIGTAYIAGAYNHKNNLQARFQRNGFFVMPYLQQREFMLRASKVAFIVKPRPNVPHKKDIFVLGNESFNMALLFGQELRRPMASGIISSKEKDTEFILKEILRRVIPEAEKGDVCFYSIPAIPVDRDMTITYHTEIFRKFLTEMGYIATPLNESTAVVYAECEDTGFTALSLDFGAGMTNTALVYKGMDIFSFSVARSGDFIDRMVSESRGISISDATAEKEKPTFDLLNPKDDVEEAIVIFYKNTLEYVLEHTNIAMEQHKRDIKLQDLLTVVVAGGTSVPKGFMQLLSNALKENPLPISIGNIRHAASPVMAVAKGCLKCAQKSLEDPQVDGVTDISNGQNERHQYPTAAKEEPQKEKTSKEKRDDIERAKVLSQGMNQFTESIDLSKK